MARWPSTATDNDRVGIRQPPPRGGIDGPCKLRGSSSRLGAASTTAAQHLTAGAAPPRLNAWSSVDNPRASGLTADSTAKVHPCRAGTEARERGGMPGVAGGPTANCRGPIVNSAAGASLESTSPEAVSAAAIEGVHPPVRGRRVATGRMPSSPTTLPPLAVGDKWSVVAAARRIEGRPSVGLPPRRTAGRRDLRSEAVVEGVHVRVHQVELGQGHSVPTPNVERVRDAGLLDPWEVRAE